ncbi:MAG: DEAD/DEAH box helicase, partial [Candidatus Eremiobacteraeota bacterium]|nr:DEAD/DEAH box helicase [Candidatus Eremiobacteraeota bacterium]
LDDLIARAAEGRLPDETLVVYVSPLKALTNDVRKNLELPLAELTARAVEMLTPMQTIRTAVRTGDTTPAQRQQMLRRPPHVMVTTPESLFILLTAERSRALFTNVSTIVVDEIHAMANSKRGSHLALTLALLDDLVVSNGGCKPQRIGLSATVRPLEPVAEFLSPAATIVDVGSRRQMGLAVCVPSDELGAVASGEMWGEIYEKLADLIRAHRTTLVFVPTRRMSERVAFALTEILGDGMVMPHHGSLARELRFDAENRLKNGELRAVVATASLELGIDIGTIDLVVQLGSPRSIAVALQRIGRSGHWVGAKPDGKIFATTRDELLECAALVRSMRGGAMDALVIPPEPLDILAQQLVAACATREWKADELYLLVRRAYPYRNLSRTDFDEVVSMLADGIATARGRSGTFLHYDRVNGVLRARRGARLAAITCGGAIPEVANYRVIAEPDGHLVGTLDEDFAIESLAGDIFLLGTTSWKIRRVEAGTVRVEDAHGAPPTVPFWNGEGLGRTIELSHDVSELRRAIDERSDEDAIALLLEECGLDRAGAQQAVAYVRSGKAVLGVVPTADTIVAERFFDEGGGMQLILHAPFGARINRAWGLALRKRFCVGFNFELQAAATDNGICISLAEQHAFPLDAVFEYVKAASAQSVLTQALLPAPMFEARWRWNAMRSLAVLRQRGGRKVAPQLLRMRADDLLASVFPDKVACPENLTGPIRIPDHVLVRETIGNCLHEAMDLGGLLDVLRGIETGAIRTVAIDTPEPSTFSHEILNANPFAYLDDAPLEERRARAVQLRRGTRVELDGAGILDPAAIAEVAQESWPVVRDAEELHDALATLIAVPPVAQWQTWFEELALQRRAALLTDGNARFWACAERLELVAKAYGDGALRQAQGEPVQAVPGMAVPSLPEEALAEIVRGWLECSGPVTVGQLAQTLALSEETVAAAMIRLETEGQVLRGRFRGREVEEWCNRRVLARIHRLTIGQLRREIEPVTTADYARFLYRWQHVALSSRLHGIDGTLQVIRQLEGYEIPAAAWEAQVLPKRVVGYKTEFLDRLCYSGEVMWGRLSPHPALLERDDERRRRVRPTKLAPIALFTRADAHELIVRAPAEPRGLSHAARDVLAEIDRRGAPFFMEIVRGSKRLPAEVEEALWQLVAAGLVSADGFDALRSLIDAKRRLGEKGLRARPRSSSGRWTRLVGEATAIDPEAFARRLLARWGVVFRDVAGRESIAPRWRDVLLALRRLEARGEIRGGRFLATIVGEQFALPDAVDALRAVRRERSEEPLTEISGYDPLAIVNAFLPEPGVSEILPSGELAAAESTQ